MLIDKTDVLEQGLAKYPSIFIEGAAACGKTTAVNMFLQAHPEATSDVFHMNKESDKKAFFQRLAELPAQTAETHFLVFEDMGAGLADGELQGGGLTDAESCSPGLTDAELRKMSNFVESLPLDSSVKVIFVSRDKPRAPMLRLLWQGRMGMVYPSSLMFTQAEVTKYVRAHSASLPPMEIYQKTGGWPGCVTALVTLASQVLIGSDIKAGRSVSQLFGRYEIQNYIREELLGGLNGRERQLLGLAAACPWINEDVCDKVLGLPDFGEVLRDLERKGLLVFNDLKGYWRAAPVIASAPKGGVDGPQGGGRVEPLQGGGEIGFTPEVAKKLGQWYVSRGAVSEALWCFKACGDEDAYRKCTINHYHLIPFDELVQTDVADWKPEATERISSVESSIRLCYLRGMQMYMKQDFAGLEREIEKVRKMEGKMAGRPEERTAAEVYLNLTFVSAKVDAAEWLDLLEERAGKWAPIRLYPFTENANDLLGGYREMSAFFACSVREEKRRMQVLKAALGPKEWLGVQLAYLSFLFEIGKRDLLGGEGWAAVLEVASGGEKYAWRFRMACLYLLHKIYFALHDGDVEGQMRILSEALAKEESPLCKAYLQAIHNIYALRRSGDSSATRWLKAASTDGSFHVNEDNYQMVFLMVKGLLAMNQPEIAGRVLRQLTPYVQKYHRNRMLAEVLFQQAIVDWAEGKNGAAVRNAVESFLYTGDARYVTFYTSYGQRGREVLGAYVDWLRNAEPEQWAGKKRYNYGNVLTMPREEYLEMLLRQAKKMDHSVGKKSAGSGHGGGKDGAESLAARTKLGRGELVEKLTLMETIILQNINKGMSNSEICEELNLKLPTVKTHISNLYKKLGVGSRVQAIVKGKEIGILR